MKQRPPDNEDPTSEEEALEFDGSHTDRLDDTYRTRVVTASENAKGIVAVDDRGTAHWKWITELEPASCDTSGTFNLLKALENPALSIEDEQRPPPTPEPPSKEGYDPYSTTAVFEKPKTRG